MSKKKLWAKFDLDMADHPKILPLSDAAFRAFIESVLWSRKQLTDGFLAKRYTVARWSLAVARELLDSDPEKPLWVEVEGGYQIRDFDQHQETKASVEAASERAKRAGQKGGLAKAKRTAKQTASKVVSKSVPETETETDVKNKQKFEAWWPHYPKKIDKVDALKAFKEAITKTDIDALIEATKTYARTTVGTEPRFIKGPAAWLRAERWTDELVPAQRVFDPYAGLPSADDLDPELAL